jgi:hypothetical protein
MRRAHYQRSIAVCEPIVSKTAAAPAADSPSETAAPPNKDAAPSTDVVLSSAGTFVHPDASTVDCNAERRRHLAIAIRQRIETRLSGRIRDLAVRFAGDTVVLEGRCATYYSKQLAQHAALGVLENEQLENTIVVAVPS